MDCLTEYWLSVIYVLISVSANIGLYFAWERSTSALGKSVRNSGLLPVIIAVQIHWFLFFGPINLFPICLNSNHQSLYPWVINKQFFAPAMLIGLFGYVSLLSFLLVISYCLLKSKISFPTESLFRREHQQSSLSVIGMSILILILAIWISPVIGTIVANDGAWFKTLPPVIRWLGKGLFLVEACPLIFSGWKTVSQLSRAKKKSAKHLKVFTVVAIFQLIAFLTLRQRFLSLLAVSFYGCIVLANIHSKKIIIALFLMLFLGYSIPSGLRYTRLAPSQFENQSDYLQASARAFFNGIKPQNLFSSAIADFSYNKSGAAALSVPLGIQNRESNWFNFNWIFVELYKPLPGSLKPHFKGWGDNRSEKLIGTWLGIGKDGKDIPGVSRSVQGGWIIDMMETPFLEPLVAGGITGVFFFSIIFALFISLIWSGTLFLTSSYSFLWPLPAGILFVLAAGASWIGDIFTLFKVVLPWILVSYLLHIIATRREKQRQKVSGQSS